MEKQKAEERERGCRKGPNVNRVVQEVLIEKVAFERSPEELRKHAMHIFGERVSLPREQHMQSL